MFLIVLLISAGMIPGTEIATGVFAADSPSPVGNESPMLTVKTTLKSWHSMYNSYREEMNLGYCWADYFFDIRNLLNTLTGPRFVGIHPEDPAPIKNLLNGLLNPEKNTPASVIEEPEKAATNLKDYDDEGYLKDQQENLQDIRQDFESSDQTEKDNYQISNPYNEQNLPNSNPPPQYFYPGVDYRQSRRLEEDDSLHLYSEPTKSSENMTKDELSGNNISELSFPNPKWEGRGLSDILVSVLGLNSPPGLGPLMFGVGPSPVIIVISRIIGAFMRVGRQVLETIETTSILACTKEYILIKIFRWIDS